MKRMVFLTCFTCFTAMAQMNESVLKFSDSSKKDVSLKSTGGIYEIVISGGSPQLGTMPLSENLNPTSDQLVFEYFCPSGLDYIEFNLFSENEVTGKVAIRDIGSTEGWSQFRVDLSKQRKDWGKKGDILQFSFGGIPKLEIHIRNMEIRPMTDREKRQESILTERKEKESILESHLKTYLSTDYSSEISRIFVGHDKIDIMGMVDENEPCYLAEVKLYENVTELKAIGDFVPIRDKHFEVSLERFNFSNGYMQDRLLSKWVLVKESGKGYIPVSHARYMDSVVPVNTFDFIKPRTKKGLGGFSTDRAAPISDLDTLGISSATVNIWVSGFFKATPKEGDISFEYMDRTFYADKEAIANLDHTLVETFNRDIEVSAILLVGKASSSVDPNIGKILEHPDFDPAGVYSMPNLTDVDGVQHYAAVMDFLANRYSRPDGKFGRIHHYIIHNEVDAGWVWTNAGEKSAQVFMDIYHKSMRLSNNIAKMYNSNSKVFISLTHHWNWTSNPKFLLSKELLQLLLQYSNAEGDFDWGVAHHPYPESLREPKTWLDEKVTYDFDTPLITFKNLEVIDHWIKRQENFFKGKTKRLLYLSENGTNSPTYSEKDLMEQAAGLAYALKKMDYLDGIDGFQYHNWQDHRQEGGLRIGLRRFPDDDEDPSGIKPAWEVYRAYGTEVQKNVFDKYKRVIGIIDWEEIHQKKN